MDKSNTRTVTTVCDSHCGGSCILKVTVKDGVITRIETDDGAEPQLRACLRGRSYRQRVYAPDRLIYPLKRTGPRGRGRFARVSWDEALDTVAQNMKRIRSEYGPASVLFFCSMADPHTIHHERTFHRLLCMFGGYTAPWGAISNEGIHFSSGVTYGSGYGQTHSPEDYLNSKLIIMWGWNPADTVQNTNTTWCLIQAKERGAKIVAIDPRYTSSAALLADEWIPARPGTDAAFLIAMAYVMINEKLHDQRFLDKYTFGFDKFRDYLLGVEDGVKKTPQWAEAITGVPAATIARLARDYATIKPGALVPGYAAGRTAYGEQFQRAAATLAAMTGNIGVHGGNPAASGMGGGTWGGKARAKAVRNVTRIPSPPNQVEVVRPPRWNALPFRSDSVNSSARVNVSLFADAILKGKAGGYNADYKMLWLSNTNYLNQLADINKAVKAFNKLEFILVTEQFMSPSAQYADIVLPVCTFMERDDFYISRNGDLCALVNKVIEPLGESKSQLEICEALALKLGIKDFNEKPAIEMVKVMADNLAKATDFPDYETLKKQGFLQVKNDEPVVAYQQEIADPERHPFPTPSGKIEIYSQVMAKMDNPLVSPIPKYYEAWESANDPLAKKYPLQLVTTHFRRRAHSQFDNLAWLRESQPQVINISTKDARMRGIKDGDLVKVFNDRGTTVLPAHVTERIMPGVADIPEGAWFKPDEKGIDQGGSANVLTCNRTSPIGAFTSNTSLVQVARAD